MGCLQLMICGWESKPATRNNQDACQIGMMFQASIVGSNKVMKAAESIIFLGRNRGLGQHLRNVPILSANHLPLTSLGSHKSWGKLVVHSSTSTNSTSLVYRWGLQNDLLDIKESLKCLGFSWSCFNSWKCASFVYVRISYKTIGLDSECTAIAGSQGSCISRGMPQSFRPGIGGGQRSWHIHDILSIGSFDVLLWLLEALWSIGEDDLETGGCGTGLSSIGLGEALWVISSEMWACMWFFSNVIDCLMMTWDWDICHTKAKKKITN